jgi:hypothetical protein
VARKLVAWALQRLHAAFQSLTLRMQSWATPVAGPGEGSVAASLARRFPGAPAQWLEVIAARAPGLAFTEWSAEHERPAGRAPPPSPETAPPLDPPDTDPRPRRTREHLRPSPRPRVRIRSWDRVSEPSSRAQTPTGSRSGERSRRARTEPASPLRTDAVRAVGSSARRAGHRGPVAPAPATPPPLTAPPPPTLSAPADAPVLGRDVFPSPAAFTARRSPNPTFSAQRTSPPTVRGPGRSAQPDDGRERTAAAIAGPMSDSEMPTRPGAGSRAPQSVTLQRAAARESPRLPANSGDPFQGTRSTQGAREPRRTLRPGLPWPAFPPPTFELESAPAGPTGVDRLRAEQDLGAWSG